MVLLLLLFFCSTVTSIIDLFVFIYLYAYYTCFHCTHWIAICPSIYNIISSPIGRIGLQYVPLDCNMSHCLHHQPGQIKPNKGRANGNSSLGPHHHTYDKIGRLTQESISFSLPPHATFSSLLSSRLPQNRRRRLLLNAPSSVRDSARPAQPASPWRWFRNAPPSPLCSARGGSCDVPIWRRRGRLRFGEPAGGGAWSGRRRTARPQFCIDASFLRRPDTRRLSPSQPSAMRLPLLFDRLSRPLEK